MSTVTLLGPQRHQPNLGHVLDELGIEGPLAVISCGWEERESEQGELRDHVKRPVVDLKLYERLEEVLAKDKPLFQALMDRNDRLRTTQSLYRKRLDHALSAVWELHTVKVARMELLMPERAAALKAVADLDAHYLDQIRAIHAAFEDIWDLRGRPAVAEVRDKVREELADAAAVLIAGGNVGVLLDRLRLLGIPALFGDCPVVAWSAGAMVITERIVLFHDSPPQGRGNPEVYDDGMALAPSIVALPHAKTRLKLDDEVRVSILAGRFLPATCVALDTGSGVRWDGEEWTAFGKTKRLTKTGKVLGMAAP